VKIALCLHGYYNNRADPQSGDKGLEYIKKNIFSKGNVDVFLHNWQPELELKLKEQYHPKGYCIEPQIDFEKVIENSDIDESYFNENFQRNKTIFAQCNIARTLSFLCSRKKSIELKKEYEKEQGIKYQSVITARFDLGQRDGNAKRKYLVSKINFDPCQDMSFLYSAMWDQLNAGYADQWFYSNSENIDLLATAYDKCFDYFRPGSTYEQKVIRGWPDSCKIDTLNRNDVGQFTNEIFKNQKSRTLMKYPKWQCINNHILYKWFCLDVGLYQKSRFV